MLRKQAVLVLTLCFFLASPLVAQENESDLREQLEALRKGQEDLRSMIMLMQQVEELRKGQEELREELAELKRLHQQETRAPERATAGSKVRDVVFDVGENPVLGENTAKLTLVEFTDYQ